MNTAGCIVSVREKVRDKGYFKMFLSHLKFFFLPHVSHFPHCHAAREGKNIAKLILSLFHYVPRLYVTQTKCRNGEWRQITIKKEFETTMPKMSLKRIVETNA
jgi:hypothetical protein